MTAEQREHEGLSRLPADKGGGASRCASDVREAGWTWSIAAAPDPGPAGGGADGAGGAARRRTQPPLFPPLDEAERVPNFEGDRRVRAAPRSCFDLAVLRVYGTDAGLVTRAFIVIPPSVR